MGWNVRSLFRTVLLALTLLAGMVPAARATIIDTAHLALVRHRTSGQVLDFTKNGFHDRRIYSPALCEYRDVYVYLPPCYNPALRYPVIFYLHGFAQDERSFFNLVPQVDAAIRSGRMPPAIIVAPDGTITGTDGFFRMRNASFYINSKAGNFEDYLMVDIWNWAHQRFSIRPEREAHVLAGVSMGGGAAYDLGIRHRDKVATIAAIFPPINLRWMDCHDNYRGNFNECCWGWRTHMKGKHEVVGVYAAGLIKIRMNAFIGPLFDWDEAVAGMSAHNPAEHLAGLQNGELAMYVAYGGRDQFNIDAQVESFLAIARCRGISVDYRYDPNGRHDLPTALRFLPCTVDWIGQKLQGYGPI